MKYCSSPRKVQYTCKGNSVFVKIRSRKKAPVKHHRNKYHARSQK